MKLIAENPFFWLIMGWSAIFFGEGYIAFAIFSKILLECFEAYQNRKRGDAAGVAK